MCVYRAEGSGKAMLVMPKNSIMIEHTFWATSLSRVTLVGRALDCVFPSAMGASPIAGERPRFKGVTEGVAGGSFDPGERFFDSSDRPDPRESCHVSKWRSGGREAIL